MPLSVEETFKIIATMGLVPGKENGSAPVDPPGALPPAVRRKKK